MSDVREIQEATKKLRNLGYEGLGWWRTQDGERLSLEDVNEQRAILAEAYLAEHPEDDEEPITREWIVSLGFRYCDDGNVKRLGHVRILQAEGGTGPDVRPWSHIASYKGQIIETVLNTRRDLRGLLRGMGGN